MLILEILTSIMRTLDVLSVHIMLHLVSETRPCILPPVVFLTENTPASLKLFLLGFFCFVLVFVDFLHILLFLCLFCLSHCSRGTSPTAADESTFLPAFSIPRPRVGPQGQTGGQRPSFPVILQISSSCTC